MAVDKKVSITLKGRDLASKALGKVRGTINRIKSAVFSLQGAFVALGAIIVGKFAKSFVTAFIKQQDAVETLKASLIATGKEGEASLRRLTRSASELQKVTRQGDEAIIAATASLALLAPALDVEGLEQAQTAIIGIAETFLKGDLEGAALAIGKTVGSTTSALNRYGIQVDVTASSQDKMAQILKQTNGLFEVSKARANTLGGRLARLGNSWGDLKERIGQFLGESEAVNTFLESVRTIIEDLTGALSRGGPQVVEAFAAIGQIGGNAFVIAFLEAMQFLEGALSKIVDDLMGTILDKLKGKDPLLKALIEARSEGRARGEAQQKALRTGVRRLFRPGTSQRLGAPPAPVAGPAAETLSLIDRLVAERIRALFAGRERLAAAGAGFRPPAAPSTGRFGGQLPDVLGAVTRGVVPTGGGAVKPRLINLRPIRPRPEAMRALFESSKAFNEALEQTKKSLAEAADLQKRAGEAARDAAAFAVQSWGFAMADLIRSIRGGGLFNILGSIGGIASLINPVVGAGILAGSAVGGALFSSSERPHVIVDRFGTSAEDSLRGMRTGPDTIVVQLLDAQGRPIREIAADLRDLELRDGVNRFSSTVQGTVTSFTEVG